MVNQPQTALKDSDNFFRLKPLAAAVRVVIAGGLFVGSAAPVFAELPIPGVDAALSPTHQVIPWLGSGDATHEIIHSKDPAHTGPQTDTLQINQKSDKAILNWQSFNVGRDNTVKFVQPDSSSVALNQIFQQNASTILGHITANGQIYLVNNNGFVFGKDSVVDANSLVASALNISPEVFNRGIIRELEKNGSPGQAALSGQTTANKNANITINAGAKIHAGKNGNIIMAAPKISNSGAISGDQNAQIILVASEDKVYLQPANSDSAFAGLLVEVGTGGKVTNEAGGSISTRQGNITLAGFAVNQSGNISATTSVNVNGSVRLLARENAQDAVSFGKHNLIATQTVRNSGTNNEQDSVVEFGKNSSVKILADQDGGSAYDDQVQKRSLVEVSADKIHMQSGSSIVAPYGVVDFKATNKLEDPLLGTGGRIDLESGSKIDVSGIKNIQVAMERNVAKVSVQSFNLRDAPYQRGGVLQGQDVKVDIRKNTAIIDASGGANLLRGVDERLSKGGDIKLTSSGDVVVNHGAVTNISGGSLAYQDGYINTTKLMTISGRVVDISDADPNEQYASIFGVVTESHAKWGVNTVYNILDQFGLGQFEKGYTEGKAAGNLNIQSPLLSWDGQLVAGSASSIYQRSNPVSGGTFTFNLEDNSGARPGQFLSSQNILFQTQPQSATVDFSSSGFPKKTNGDPIDLVFSTALMNHSGISNLTVKTGGKVIVEEDAHIAMPALSKFNVDATSIDVNGSIYSAGGNIRLNSVGTSLTGSGRMNLADKSVIDVSGRWVNDLQKGLAATLTEPLIINSGSVTLNATNDLNFNKNADIKADGGGWLNSIGRLTAGNGGNINLTAGTSSIPGLLHIDGGLSAYGLNQNGSLTLAASKINVGNSSGDANALNLGVTNGHFDIAPDFGFSAINLVSNSQDITVKANTDLSLISQNRILNADYRNHASSNSIAQFSQVATLPENLRTPVSLSLNGLTGVTLETGSAIHVDPNKGSAINLTTSNTGRGIYIDGLLDAKAGTIAVTLNADQQTEYDANQSLWLGSHAQLTTQGATRLNLPDALGRVSGDVLAGGNVALTANRGYVVLEQGSKIDVSGTSARLSLPDLNPSGIGSVIAEKVLSSDAGKISIRAAEGVLLDGTLSAKAGSSSNQGGRLDLTLDRNQRNEPFQSQFPSDALQINVVQHNTKLEPDSLHFGSLLPDTLKGKATVSADLITRAGLNELSLNLPFQSNGRPAGEVRFNGDVNLSTASSINIDAETIGWTGVNGGSTGKVNLNTAFLQLGSSTNNLMTGTSVTGGGKLSSHATWTQLNGTALLTGFNQIDLNSSHDLRAVGFRQQGQRAFTGNFTTSADLTLNASQIYPSTLTDFTFAVTRPNGQLTLAGHNTDTSPLSAAGKLTFNAPVINQNGVLKAPLGTIALNASQRLSFGKGSLTSVSAEGKTIPFGLITNNLWEYPLLADGNLVFNQAPNNLTLGEKHLVFTSPDIQFQKGSVVDVSGGGDLQAAEFQPGLGGSFDYLDPGSTSYRGGFAILPTQKLSLSPFDPYLSANFNYDSRAKIHLSGTDTLPAGEYNILPARYALLPGAYLVTKLPNTQDQVITSFTKSGLPIISGYQIVDGTHIRDSRLNGYLIETSDDVKKHSQYDIQTANNFFTQQATLKNTATPLLPQDAGQISIDATSSVAGTKTKLVLEGKLNVSAPNGRGARLDISAKNIKVVKNLSVAGTPGVLEILDNNLTNLHVDSLLLGGTRTFDNQSGNTNLVVTADAVTFEKGAQLHTLDLVAAGKNSVEVKNGATIDSSGKVNTGDSVFNVAGDSALLRVSADRQVSVNHDSSTGSTGIIKVDQGSLLKATGSILLDASQSNFVAGQDSSLLDGDISMKGGSLSLTANAINVGEITGVHANSFDLSNKKLANLSVDELLLNSRSSINFYGNVGQLDQSGKLSPIHFNNLVLDTGALSGVDNAGKIARLEAKNLQLQNTHNGIALQSGAGTGLLELSADQYKQGNGHINLDGFNAVNINADKQFTGIGNSVITVAADLNIAAGSITTTGGHKLVIDASSGNGHDVVITGNPGTNQLPSSDFGGSVSVNANSIELNNAKIILPSGELALHAMGTPTSANPQAGDVLIDGNTNIDLAGRAVNFADKLEYTPGGTLRAASDQGKVVLTADTRVDVSTGGGNAAGGNLIFKAPQQTVDLLGTLKATGASASIDANQFSVTAGFNSLMNQLMSAGVSNSIYFRTRTDDIIQQADNVIKANNLTLVADKGKIDISGTLNADGNQDGGAVKLYAGNKISLKDHALVSAKGSVHGGKVLLSSDDSLLTDQSGIELMSGSKIDVSGANANSGGKVILSALRTNDNVNIKPIAGTVLGYSDFYAQGIQKYTIANSPTLLGDGVIDSQDMDVINGQTASYMAATSQNVANLGGGVQLRPGVEIDYDGDLSVANTWDFSNQRFGQNADIPGTLAIRTSGNLDLNNSITDGLDSQGKLQTGDSWSFQLVAGADQTSADKIATAASKDLTIQHNASVHTGSGDIQLVSGGNIVFTDQTSTVYNAGRADINNRYGSLDGKPRVAGDYPVAGGDLVLRAGGDIKGAVTTQFLNQWLTRQGNESPRASNTRLTTWAIDAIKFQQNVGSFGGGKVDIAAAGNINDLSVMLPTTGKQLGTSFNNNILQIQGGGQLHVNAGGDIAGGAYFLGKGEGSLSAGGEIKGSVNQFKDGPQLVMSGDQSNPVGGNSKLTLNANQGIKIAAVSDAMMLTNTSSSNLSNTKFFTYTDKSSLTLKSLSGDVHLGANTGVSASILNINNSFEQLLTHVYPASLNATAFNGSVKLDNDILLFPSATSNLNIFAKQDISSSGDQNINSIIMSDADPQLLPNITSRPLFAGDPKITAAANTFDPLLISRGAAEVRNLIHAVIPVHQNDFDPARLVTQEGDISSVQINLPKNALIQAGRDLINSPIQIQHNPGLSGNTLPASIISAGRDLTFVTSLTPDGFLDLSKSQFNKIEIAGPGGALIKTGRNLDLGSSVGLSTVGNLLNANLPSKGASLDVVVGLNGGAPDYIGFINKYQSDPFYKQILTVLKNEITGFMQQRTGNFAMTEADALKAFRKLNKDDTLPLQPELNQITERVLFEELKVAGSISAADKTKGNQSGFDAITTLFPGNQWRGDLNLFFSKLQTVVGGDINLLVPGGQVNAGLAVAPSGTGAKSADQLGIVVQGEGQINAFVKDNFIVNTSRVFTLGGGDILIWSSEGDIDAGKGAKSALSVSVDPPFFDSHDQLVIPAPRITNGSGIRTAGPAGVTPGDVFLFAPKGVVNAGEAGIGGTNVTISATAVLGANNIQIGGVSSGVPVASSGSLAAGLTGTSNLTANVSQVAQTTTGLDNGSAGGNPNMALGMLTVEFYGFGDDSEQGSDEQKSKPAANKKAGKAQTGNL